MRAGDLLKEIETFRNEMVAHQNLWGASLDQPIPDYPVRNIEELRQQSLQLCRTLGRLRPYLEYFRDSWVMHHPATGTQWDAPEAAAGLDQVAQVKGPSLAAMVPALDQIIGQLGVFGPGNDVPLEKPSSSRARRSAGIGTMTDVDKSRVFVIHGRVETVNEAMFDFLRALHLKPLEWSQLIAETGKGSPHIGEVIDQGLRNAGAVVAVLTPDNRAFLHPVLHKPNDGADEKQPTPQARPNVLFEMGMAFALHPEQTILVAVGRLRAFSDIAGRHVLHFDGSAKARNALKSRLQAAGCPVSEKGEDWLRVGNFSLPPMAEFTLDLSASTLGTAVPPQGPEQEGDLESKRQLVYALVIEILTKLHGEYFVEGSTTNVLPGYLWYSKYPDWLKSVRQLVNISGIDGRAEAIVEPSAFRSIDRGKMKAAAEVVGMYLWASDHNDQFQTLRQRHDLPDPDYLRRVFHDAQLGSL